MNTENSTLFGTNNIIETLAKTPEAKTPVFSCFVSLEQGKEQARLIAESNFLEFRRILPDAFQQYADEAMIEFELTLFQHVDSKSKGFAFYYRAGSAPFCHWTEMEVSLKNAFIIGRNPVLTPLLELQDQYDRYFVLISTHEKARILEIRLGTTVEDKWLGHSQESSNLSRSMSYRHYQNNMADRGDQFFEEKLNIITQLLQGVPQKRLILAGYPENINRLKEMLPLHLQDHILDELPLCDKNDPEKIVMATLDKLVKQEMLESETKLQQLHHEYEKDGLAVLGAAACQDAILSGMVDTLVVTQSIKPNAPIWKAYLRDWQSEEGMHDMTALFESEKETVLRLALENDVMVEFVQPDWLLDAHDGMGALLRYQSTPITQHLSLSDIEETALQSA